MKQLGKILAGATVASMAATVFFYVARHEVVAWAHVWAWCALMGLSYTALHGWKFPTRHGIDSFKHVVAVIAAVIATEIAALALDPAVSKPSDTVIALLAAAGLTIAILDQWVVLPRGTNDDAVWTIPTYPAAAAEPIRLPNKIVGWYMLVITFGALYTFFFSLFVPSVLTLKIAYAIALVTAVLVAAFMLGIGGFGWNPNSARVAAAIRTSPMIGKAYVRVPLLSCVMGAFAVLTFSGCVPGILNSLIGSQGDMTLTINGWQGASYNFRSGYQCARPTVSGIPELLIPQHALCPTNAKRSLYPVGARLILHGTESIFGIHATRLTVVRL